MDRPVVTTELKKLTGLALPLVVTQLAQMGLGVLDTIMAGRVSAVELAGVALGGVIFWPVLMLIAGIVMAVIPTVSQLHGGGRVREAGAVVRQALWIALFCGLTMIILLYNLEPMYHFVGVDPLAIPVTMAYVKAMSWGVLPVLGYFVLRYLCEGTSWTTPAMLIAGSAFLLKIPLNYWFIYGGMGLPAMGGEGCGWATSVVMAYEFIAIICVVQFSRVKVTNVFAEFSWPDAIEIKRLVWLGLPIGLSTFAEFSIFSAVTLLIGRLGVETVAANQIVNNVSGLVFMIPLGLGMATSIRVGYNVGAGDYVAARLSGLVAVGTGFVFALFAVSSLLLGGEFIVSLYSTEASVVELATGLIVIVALFQLSDDLQVIGMGALRGYKDTRAPFLIALICYWVVGFPVAWMLGFGYFEALDLGVYGYWIGMATGLTCAAILLLYRFNRVSRREIVAHKSLPSQQAR
jgi:MATE family multidrug resistance protein